MKYMMFDTQIVYKLPQYTRIQFDSYKDGGISELSKVHQHPPTKLLKKSKKMIFID